MVGVCGFFEILTKPTYLSSMDIFEQYDNLQKITQRNAGAQLKIFQYLLCKIKKKNMLF